MLVSLYVLYSMYSVSMYVYTACLHACMYVCMYECFFLCMYIYVLYYKYKSAMYVQYV